MKKIIKTLLLIFSIEVFGGLDLLLADHWKNIFEFLNTRDLYICGQLNKNINQVFVIYFKNKKEKEIEQYLKNNIHFWTKVVTKLKKGDVIRLPRSEFLKKIVLKLFEEIMPFYLFSGTWYETLINQMRNKQPKKKVKNIHQLNYYRKNFGWEYKIHIDDHCRKRSMIVIEGKNYVIIDIPGIAPAEFKKQLERYYFDQNKQVYLVFRCNGKRIQGFLKTIDKKISKEQIKVIDIANAVLNNSQLFSICFNTNYDASIYIRDNNCMDYLQTMNYNNLMNNALKYKNIINVVNKDENYSISHRFCNYYIKPKHINDKYMNRITMPLIKDAYCGKMAFKYLKSLPWYQKMPFSEKNTLELLFKNMNEIPINIQFENINELPINTEKILLEHFVPAFIKSVDPKGCWLYYEERNKQFLNYFFLFEQIDFCKPIINWLHKTLNNDIKKHGFNMQQKLLTYLSKECVDYKNC